MTKWEYIQVETWNDLSGKLINGGNVTSYSELGGLGWELVSIWRYVATFKRPILLEHKFSPDGRNDDEIIEIMEKLLEKMTKYND